MWNCVFTSGLYLVSDTRPSPETALRGEKVSDTSWEVPYAIAIKGDEVSDTAALGGEKVSDTSWEVHYAIAIKGDEVSDTT